MNDTKKLALGMAVLTHVTKAVKPALDEMRGQINGALENGDRVSISSPLDGTYIGAASKSKPKPVAKVSDSEALLAWMQEHYPEHVVEVDRIPSASMSAAIGYIQRYAPNLLETSVELYPYALAEVLNKSAAANQPVGPGGEMDVPGIEVTVPEGNTSIRLDPQAGAVIEELIVGGVVALDGQVREIEAGA